MAISCNSVKEVAMKRTEITKLTNKVNKDVYVVITKGKISVLVMLIHKFTVWKLKRYLKFVLKFKMIDS